MTLVPRREYAILLIGDVLIFSLSLWATITLRYLTFPSFALFQTYLLPFSFLFAAWIVVFFLAGLYGRYTRIFRLRLTTTILYTQTINMIIAALFFFLVPAYGIAPKAFLVVYLVVSFILVLAWRMGIFPSIRTGRRLKGVLIAPGLDGKALSDEVKADTRFQFSFDHILDTSSVATHEVIQQACRVAEQDDVSFLVVDYFDPATEAVLPIIYDAAFRKHRFALVDATDLYQEVFDRVPLSWMRYEWILRYTSSSRVYDVGKRFIDIIFALVAGSVSLLAYPFVALAIKLDDGGMIFITQERVGRYQKPIRILKFRTMSGNDNGVYGADGKSTLKITRVGQMAAYLAPRRAAADLEHPQGRPLARWPAPRAPGACCAVQRADPVLQRALSHRTGSHWLGTDPPRPRSASRRRHCRDQGEALVRLVLSAPPLTRARYFHHLTNDPHRTHGARLLIIHIHDN